MEMKVKKVGRAGIDRMVTKLIRTSTKAPRNFNEARLRARETASGIRGAVKEKAKKSKLGAGFWFLVLIIIVPILVVGYFILNRRVELPGEGQFTDEDFKP
ncbi:unnamed protein product [marine sediment metagenome]|uniref:Uncharacterized protein n=1 Tax=marine sediment metagenome TaxID=412755 RepID=X1TQ46_9ZZZZ